MEEYKLVSHEASEGARLWCDGRHAQGRKRSSGWQQSLGGRSLARLRRRVSAILADVRHVACGCTQSAVVALTKYIATQMGKQRIRCNTISPGAILTDTLRANESEENINMLLRHQAVPDRGEPIDIAKPRRVPRMRRIAVRHGMNISRDVAAASQGVER